MIKKPKIQNDFNGSMYLGRNRFTYNEPLESQGFGLYELELLKDWFPLFNTDYVNIASKTTPQTALPRANRVSTALDPNDIDG